MILPFWLVNAFYCLDRKSARSHAFIADRSAFFNHVASRHEDALAALWLPIGGIAGTMSWLHARKSDAPVIGARIAKMLAGEDDLYQGPQELEISPLAALTLTNPPAHSDGIPSEPRE